MYKYKKLYNEYVEGLKSLTPLQLKGISSTKARGLPYYGCLRKNYQKHFQSFSGMHKRLKISNLSTDFPRTLEGFISFIEYLGPIPCNMIKPTLGRLDHTLGYVKGNFEWQASKENSSEVGLRNSINLVNVHFVKGAKFYTDGIRNFKLLPNDPKIKDLNLKLGHTHIPDKKVICPHCGKEGGNKRMKQIHFDKCKNKSIGSVE